MTPNEWKQAALKTDWVVIDTENYFWQSRKKHDLPDLPDGTKFDDFLKDWCKTKGLKQNDKVVVTELPQEIQEHITKWHRYCYAVGFQATGLPSLVWTELVDDPAPRDVIGDFLRDLVRNVPIVFHNSLHDIGVIEENWGILIEYYLRIHDSMQLHNLMWPELPHKLDFCSSTSSSQNRHKQLGTHSPVYLQGDVKTTEEVFRTLLYEIERDPQSREVYETLQLPLIPIIHEAHKRGIRIDREMLAEKKVEFQTLVDKCQSIANEFVTEFSGGEITTINMRSPKQVQEWLFNKLKLKYPGMRKSPKSGGYSTDKDAMAALQGLFVPPDKKRDTLDLRLELGGNPLVEAKAYFTSADKLLGSFINSSLGLDRVYPNFAIHGQATGRWSTTDPAIPQWPETMKPVLIPDDDEVWVGGDWSNAELRIFAHLTGDELLLEGFANGWDLHSMHVAQAFGWDNPVGRMRWLQFMINDGDHPIHGYTPQDVRDLVTPGWWGSIDPKLWKETKVPLSLDWEQWLKFGGPCAGWNGDKDLFRRFAKILIFRLMYGGSPDRASEIPGAMALGLPTKMLVKSSKDLILSHPWWQEFWDKVGDEAKFHKIVRNYNGRSRRLMATRQAERYRAGINFPIQSLVSDTLNRTLIEIKKRAPWARFVYSIHDSFYFGGSKARVKELQDIVYECATMPVAGGLVIPFDIEIVTYEKGRKVTRHE